jgi:hypothetical protein
MRRIGFLLVTAVAVLFVIAIVASPARVQLLRSKVQTLREGEPGESLGEFAEGLDEALEP